MFNKKSQGEILTNLIFIFIILIIIFLFSKLHESILISNYNLNNYELNYNNAFNLKSLLTTCFGYPLDIKTNKICYYNNTNFNINLIKSESCNNITILKNGKTNLTYHVTIYLPILYNSSVCLGKLNYYYN